MHERERRGGGLQRMAPVVAREAVVARFGMLRWARKRAREQQRLGRVTERVGCMPARLDERGHRVNYDLMPT